MKRIFTKKPGSICTVKNIQIYSCAFFLGFLTPVLGAQSKNQPTSDALPQPDSRIVQSKDLTDTFPKWITDRLVKLTPDEPLGYFRLGEDVAAERENRAEEELARTLFGLAYELDRQTGSSSWLAPSSCIALASLARLESDRRWLWALANRLDSRYALPDWQQAGSHSIAGNTADDAAGAPGATLVGQGMRARSLLKKQGVRSVILRYGQLLGFSSASGALWQIDQWADAWPCPECGNERVVFRPNTDPPSYRECYTCRGNPGPVISRTQTIAYLRFESRLLHGISRSWGAQLTIDYGAPLREPDPETLAGVLGIDAGKPYWHDGAWHDLPAAPNPSK